MNYKLRRANISYINLNSKQQEAYNFQLISAVLALKGFSTMKLSDDYNGADFLAQDMLDGEIFKIQLKGCFTLAKKYVGKDIFIAFTDRKHWYVYPHDLLMRQVAEFNNYENTESWKSKSSMYTFPRLTKKLYEVLGEYRLA